MRRLALAAAMALLAGIFYLILGVFKMGWISNFLAASVLAGFIAGIAIDVAIGQLDNLFGIVIEDGNSWQELLWTIQALPTLNVTATVIGVGSLIILFSMKKWTPKIPGALVVVILGIAVVGIFGLQETMRYRRRCADRIAADRPARYRWHGSARACGPGRDRHSISRVLRNPGRRAFVRGQIPLRYFHRPGNDR